MAESVLLDVRSGLVPFTDRTLHDFTVDESNSFIESVREAEIEAFTTALEDNAAHLVEHLEAANAR